MPALVPYPNCLRVKVQWALGTDANVDNSLHFTWAGTPPTAATLDTVATDIYGFAVSALIGELSTDSSLVGVEVTDLTSSTAAQGIHVATTSGTRGSGTVAGGLCALLSCKISRRYRGGKPRTYWPFGVPADLYTAQLWNPTWIGTLLTQMQAFINDILAVSVSGMTIGEFVSLSYYEGNVNTAPDPITGRIKNKPKPRTVAIAPDPIVSYAFNPNYASQRRRNQII
jgi:hypothetical protein